MKNADQPAHPVHGGYEDDDRRNQIIGGGLTKREYFAAIAMQGLLTKLDHYDGEGNQAMSGLCYDAVSYADQLLRSLEQRPS